MNIIKWLSIYAFFINILGFLICLYDKQCAIKNNWRVSEKRLFMIALLGGAVGFYAGMQIVRHKTKHWYFKWLIPIIGIIHILLFILSIYKYS